MFGREEKVPQAKIAVVQYGILLIFLLLAFGLWRLQVSGSNRYETLAERNRIRTVPILAPRGKIVDREGRLLVDNYPSFSALLLRDQLKDKDVHIEQIAAGLHVPPEKLRERLRKAGSLPKNHLIILKDDITRDELAFIEAHRQELPELDTLMVHRRLYPKYGFAAHLIGYVGEVSEDTLLQPDYELYQAGDIVGKSGLEQYYNDILMGQDGSQRTLVNSRGQEVGRLSETPALPGKTLKLTIDLDLQIAAEEAIEATGKNGAIVALDPRTGEVLAMVSRPTFEANNFSVGMSREDWSRLISDPGHPLLNKAIQAQLAPGSVFKIIMSVAGLQEGIAQKMRVNCGGGAVFYGRFFKCWITSQHTTHGLVEINKAISQSCDTFFYTLAERLGIARIAKYATALGLGQKTHIDLPQEATGVMPSEEWKVRTLKQRWYAGETISVGIGQGAIAVTPIQLARTIAGITSDGVLRRPHVVSFGDLPSDYRARYEQLVVGYPDEVHVPIDPKNWTTITDAMAGVVSTGGTAAASHLEGIDFAGKTGSAQVISNTAIKRLGKVAKKDFKDNGWFVGLEPRRNPEIAVTVLLEEGEHGAAAAHLAAAVVKAYVEKQRRRNLKLAQSDGGPTVEMAGLWDSSDAADAGPRAASLRIRLGPGKVVRAKVAPGLAPPNCRSPHPTPERRS